MEDHIIKLIIFAVFSWTSLFLLIRKLLPNYSYEFSNRLVSTTHASLAVTLSLLSVQDWSCPICPYASPSTLKQKQTLAITVGYLIYDSVCSHFDERSTSNLDNIIHHLVSIIGLGAGLAYQKCGAEMAATIFITEISSPFLHLRELLKELGYKDTDLNLAADVLFALIFSVARMVGGPYLAYVTLTADNPLLIKPHKSQVLHPSQSNKRVGQTCYNKKTRVCRTVM
ncbi:uncharacterized protein LOC141585904 isoform X2 [Silene latifolia]|uniref:uncharacterized protein LOC141585904 isoform X2 n=1 Tax=Silene latifolia TaxID=37657 RepID=UPI003D7773A1